VQFAYMDMRAIALVSVCCQSALLSN
jgi:hypothetical protein